MTQWTEDPRSTTPKPYETLAALEGALDDTDTGTYAARGTVLQRLLATARLALSAPPTPREESGAPTSAPTRWHMGNAFEDSPEYQEEADALKDALAQLRDLHGALQHDDRIVPLDVRFHKLDEAIRRVNSARPSSSPDKAHVCDFIIATTGPYMGCDCGKTQYIGDEVMAPSDARPAINNPDLLVDRATPPEADRNG